MRMRMIDSHNILWKIWTVVNILPLFWREISTERGGYLYFKFMCYQNPGHLDKDGNNCDSVPSTNCDPHFKICINNIPMKDMSKCSIYYKESESFDNADSVCINPNDNRGSLKTAIHSELPFPLQKIYYVRIEVYDQDGWTSTITSIATFEAQFTQMPAFNMEKPIFQKVNMHRVDYPYRNKKASLQVEMALQCDKDKYGDYCMDFCRAAPSDNYVCDRNGKKKCKEGWKGEHCDYMDPCLQISCKSGADCIEHKGKVMCYCNGQAGPQCQSTYNPCLPNPCHNKGICFPNKNGEKGIRCQCKSPFHGLYCESQTDLCQLEPCQNNATCEYIENYERRCICSAGYFGKLCDQEIDKEDKMISNGSVVLNNTTSRRWQIRNDYSTTTLVTIFIGCFLLFIITIMAILQCRYRLIRKEYNLKRFKPIPVSMREIEQHLGTPRVLSNIYVEKHVDEGVYEAVDDRNTYAYLTDSNDDYLIPKTSVSDGVQKSPLSDNSVYLDMSSISQSERKLMPTNRNSEVPPLPKRVFKRKESLKDKFCFS